MLAKLRSRINISSWIPKLQFSDNSFNLPNKCSIDSPFYCFVVRSMYLTDVTLRDQMKASSIIFQSSTVNFISILVCGFLLHMILLPSVSSLRYNIEMALRSVWLPRFFITLDSFFYLSLAAIFPVHFQLFFSSESIAF